MCKSCVIEILAWLIIIAFIISVILILKEIIILIIALLPIIIEFIIKVLVYVGMTLACISILLWIMSAFDD